MLSGIHEVDQSTLLDVYKFGCRTGANIMVFAPAGSGKTQMAQQAAVETGNKYVYVDLSVLEAPDFIGLPVISEDKKWADYASPRWMPCKDALEKDAEPVVIIFDEVDKARPELQAPLLEVLLEHSINGRALNIKTCLLTGNLPDEGAFSQPVSHALTNRCSVFKMQPNFDAWQGWAVKAGINPLVVGFLSRNPDQLLLPPADGDPTAYCHASPRSWTFAARDLDSLDRNQDTTFQTMLVAGRVGMGSAAKFRVWLDHYRHIEPLVDKLVKDGTAPPDMSIDRLIVCCISAVGAISQECRRQDEAHKTNKSKKDPDKVYKISGHVLKWLSKQDTEFQIAAIKNAFDMDLIRDWSLTKVPGFMECVNRTRGVLKSK